MEFRPCIDIHNGKVKQIVGGSLQDQGDRAKENFVAEQDASFYAEFYKKDCIQGGHVILLNSRDSEYYEKTKEQAMQALKAYPGGLPDRWRNLRRKCGRVFKSRSISCNRHQLCIQRWTDQL